jgi:hypothetical protein
VTFLRGGDETGMSFRAERGGPRKPLDGVFSKLLGLAHRLFAIELRRLQQRRVAYTEK